MRPFGVGARNSARALATAYAAVAHGPETSDEVFIRIQSVQHYLWRAVDQDGVVLDILVQPWRDAKAAKRCSRRLMDPSLHFGPEEPD
jgi:transposase-like protein